MARVVERATLPPDRPGVLERDRAWARSWFAYLNGQPG